MSTLVDRICAELAPVFEIPALNQKDPKLRFMRLERAPSLIADALREFEESRERRMIWRSIAIESRSIEGRSW